MTKNAEILALIGTKCPICGQTIQDQEICIGCPDDNCCWANDTCSNGTTGFISYREDNLIMSFHIPNGDIYIYNTNYERVHEDEKYRFILKPKFKYSDVDVWRNKIKQHYERQLKLLRFK